MSGPTQRANVHKYSRRHASLTFVPKYLRTCYLAETISAVWSERIPVPSDPREIRRKSMLPRSALLESYLDRCCTFNICPISCVRDLTPSCCAVLINIPRCSISLSLSLSLSLELYWKKRTLRTRDKSLKKVIYLLYIKKNKRYNDAMRYRFAIKK